MKIFNFVRMLPVAPIDARPRFRAAPRYYGGHSRAPLVDIMTSRITFGQSVSSQFVAQHDYIESRLIKLNQADREAVEEFMQQYYFPQVARKFGPAVVYG